jgi:hypothetical protein
MPEERVARDPTAQWFGQRRCSNASGSQWAQKRFMNLMRLLSSTSGASIQLRGLFMPSGSITARALPHG